MRRLGEVAQGCKTFQDDFKLLSLSAEVDLNRGKRVALCCSRKQLLHVLFQGSGTEEVLP